jgi:hypothetical protein
MEFLIDFVGDFSPGEPGLLREVRDQVVLRRLPRGPFRFGLVSWFCWAVSLVDELFRFRGVATVADAPMSHPT